MMNDKFDRNSFKKFGLKRHFESFKFALEGIIYAFKYEQNILIHFIATIFVIILGLILKISITKWLLLILTISSVISLELVNSAIEAAVDLTTDKIHPLAKIAKDCGSAAVLISAIAAVIIGLIIFIPEIVNFLN